MWSKGHQAYGLEPRRESRGAGAVRVLFPICLICVTESLGSPRHVPEPRPYPIFNNCAGLTCVARRTGRKTAAVAAASRMTTAAIIAIGSRLLTL